MAATTALALATAAVFVATPAGASRRTSTPHRSVEAVVNRMGGIAGRVTDTSGEGIKGVCVTAVNRTVIEGATVTGRTGRYLFGGLMAGRYRLEFTTCSSSERYFPEWYPGTSSALTGRQVTVTPGRLGHVGDVVLHSLGMGSAARSSSVRKADRTRTRMLARLGSRASAATSVRTGATGSISGIVTDLSKKPLEGICVDAFGISPNVGSGFAATAANGTYTVTGLPAGGYTVEFSGIYCGNSGNYLPQWYDGQSSDASATTVNVTAGKTTGGISAMMLPGGAITGAVTASGKPLSGVGVTAFGANGGYGSTSTAANGTYTITQLPADTYTVEFSASVGNYLIQWWDGQSSQGTATPLPLKAGEIAKNIDAKMLSGGIITGTVTNTKGTALSGICVSANSVIAGGVSEYAQTLGGGHYSVQSLPTGSYTVAFSNCSGGTTNFAPQWSGGSATLSSAKGVSVTEGKTTAPVDARMPTGGAISGVVTAGGKPLGKACVDAFSTDGFSGSAVTAGNGSYSILNLATGAYSVSFYACESEAGYLTQSYRNENGGNLANPVSVVLGQTTTPVDASLILGGSISGKVTNSGGIALSGICVDASGLTAGTTEGGATTAANGDYTITGLASGKYSVSFTASIGCGSLGNYQEQWYDGRTTAASAKPVSVTDGVRTKNIGAKLQAAGTISGKVTNSGTTPLYDICVSLVNKNPAGTGGFTTTSSDGTYSISYLSSGTYYVEFTPDCGNPGNYAELWYKQKSSSTTATPVTVTAGKTTKNIGAKMETGGTITGRVTNAKGTPLMGICVFVSGTEGFGGATTTAAGTYSADDLGTGKYTVEFSPGCDSGNNTNFLIQWYKQKSSGTSATPVTVTAGKTTPSIGARMETGGTITGTVTSAAGTLFAMCVSVSGPLGSGAATTSITGSYTVTALPSGNYTVSVSTYCGSELGNYVPEWYKQKSSSTTATPVKVTAGKTTSGIGVKVSPDGEISGTVTASSGGADLTGICVEANSLTNPGPYEIAITQKGSYLMVAMLPGSYKIEFVAGCGSTGTYAAQWYDGKSSEGAANPVLVAAGVQKGGISAKLSP